MHNAGTLYLNGNGKSYTDVYCEARFFRPTGLGNRLFSWARSSIFSQQTGCKMFAPQWAHVRAASILRGGIDYSNALRKILLFDNFVPAVNEVKGLAKFLIRKGCMVMPVNTLEEAHLAMYAKHTKHTKRLISFNGHAAHVFDDLWMHNETILSSLKDITKNKWYPSGAIFQQPFIGINVRMGNDFKRAADRAEFLNNNSVYLQTPIEWYVESLRKTRDIVGNDYMAVVVSDGSKEDLKTLLEEPNVIFGKAKSAIADLLMLTQATILIGAGRSSFSAWASFLGKMPTITIPGSSLQGFHVSEDPRNHYVGEFNPCEPSNAYVKALRNHRL